MVMELLGSCLDQLMRNCGGKFSLQTTLMIADQILTRLEYIHSSRFIHRDIKPENIAVGVNGTANTIYLLDYGLAKQYKDSLSNQHIPYLDNKELTGTLRYSSLNTHLGIEQSRRDDMESLGYTLVHCATGSLPWYKIHCRLDERQEAKVLTKMLNTPIETLCKGLPVEFLKYFQHVRTLKFEQKPNYKYLKRLFSDLYNEQQTTSPSVFDWTTSKYVLLY